MMDGMEWARAGKTNIAIEKYISGDCLSLSPSPLLLSGCSVCRFALPKNRMDRTMAFFLPCPVLDFKIPHQN
jgi:hypothetical protein